MPPRTRLPVAVAMCVAMTAPWLAPHAAHAESFEMWGNEPLRPTEFGAWPNVMPVVNHRSRVYGVTGGLRPYHRLYFRGDTDALNVALRAFANVGGEKLLVIRPGPAEVVSLLKKKHVLYDWNVDLVDRPATLTIRPGVNVELDGIIAPPGVKVLHTADLLARHRAALKEADKHTRVRAAMALPDIEPYAGQDARAMADMLDGEEKDRQIIWLTTDAISRYGVRARFALPALRGLLSHEHKYVRERAVAAIEAIESAAEDAEAAEAHREMVNRIEKFVQALKADDP